MRYHFFFPRVRFFFWHPRTNKIAQQPVHFPWLLYKYRDAIPLLPCRIWTRVLFRITCHAAPSRALLAAILLKNSHFQSHAPPRHDRIADEMRARCAFSHCRTAKKRSPFDVDAADDSAPDPAAPPACRISTSSEFIGTPVEAGIGGGGGGGGTNERNDRNGRHQTAFRAVGRVNSASNKTRRLAAGWPS